MAENLGGKFATMSEDERRRFAMEQERQRERPDRASEGEEPATDEELEFKDPRHDHDRTRADLEDRDGAGAQVDDAQHAERVRREARARSKSPRPPA